MSGPEHPSNNDAENKIDIWRDSPLRFMGYANEIGESFRPILPKLVLPTYALALGYVAGDTLHKTTEAHKVHGVVTAPPVAHAAIDTLVWQVFASVAIPGLVINRAVKASSMVLDSKALASVVPTVAKRWAPTLLGLAIVPFIVEPIDEFVHHVMDNSTRKYLTTSVPAKHSGQKSASETTKED